MIKDKNEVYRILLKDLFAPGTDKIVFFYDGFFHVLKRNLLEVISKAEAYQCLNSSYLLWEVNQMGKIKEELPSDCPEVICKTICASEVPGQFLQLLFDLHFKESIIDNINKN